MLRGARIAALSALLVSAPAGGQIHVESGARSGPMVRTGSVTSEDSDCIECRERRCRYYLDRAEKMLGDGKHYLAQQALTRAKSLRCLSFSDLAVDLRELQRKLAEAGQAKLEHADQEYEKGEYKKALASYQRIAVAFGGTPAGAAAKARLARAKVDPELQAALAEVRAATMFKTVEVIVQYQRRRLAEAARPTTAPGPTSSPGRTPAARTELEILKLLGDQQLLRATDQMRRIVKSCSGVPTAEKSARYLAALRADPKLKARLDRLRRGRQATQALGLAQAYRKAGMFAKAAERYRGVIQSFPGTPQAEQARDQLLAVEAKLKGPYNTGEGR